MRAFDPSVAPAHRISLFRRHGRKIHCVFTAAPRQSGLAGADRLRIWSSILRCFQKSDLSFFSAGGPTVPCHAKATKPCKKAGRKRPKSGQSTRKAGLWHSQDPRTRPHFQCHPLHPSCRYRPQRMGGIIVSIRTGYAALPSHKICNFPEKERLARKAMLWALRCGRFLPPVAALFFPSFSALSSAKQALFRKRQKQESIKRCFPAFDTCGLSSASTMRKADRTWAPSTFPCSIPPIYA